MQEDKPEQSHCRSGHSHPKKGGPERLLAQCAQASAKGSQKKA
ncbi:MAG: hypothetical protein HW409_176, partial [candidate division NC10 bacterium]|nr:hypothetical protein [candidate division NC10 bacterium]